MLKQIFIFGFVLLSLVGYGQKSKLIQNVNVRAKELKHKLNSTGDSLILVSERKIYTVEIFNNNFERKVHVKDKKVTISLRDLPVGKFLVEATLVDKLIVMTLLRNEPFNNVKKETLKSKKVTQVIDKPKKITTKENALNDESSALSTTSSIYKGNDLKTVGNLSINTNTKTKSYWVEYKINNGHNSQKITRMADKKLVEKFIARNKIEMKTKSGRLNELVIWEVYDTSAFMKFKRLNANNLNADSESFNSIPYFKTEYFLSSL
jgi:hypothetical protein